MGECWRVFLCVQSAHHKHAHFVSVQIARRSCTLAQQHTGPIRYTHPWLLTSSSILYAHILGARRHKSALTFSTALEPDLSPGCVQTRAHLKARPRTNVLHRLPHRILRRPPRGHLPACAGGCATAAPRCDADSRVGPSFPARRNPRTVGSHGRSPPPARCPGAFSLRVLPRRGGGRGVAGVPACSGVEMSAIRNSVERELAPPTPEHTL